MNAAARALTHSDVFAGSWKGVVTTRRFWLVGLLVLSVLGSAFGLVYTRDINRHQFSQLQSLKRQQAALQVQWGQLLLEQSTWATQARVQRIAADELQMHAPNRVVTL